MKSSDVPVQERGKTGTTMFWKVAEVAAATGVGERTVWRLVSSGHFPKPVYIGGSARWRVRDVENFPFPDQPN
jgi:predicted DNA-binding transcriptional regulator AlpA